MTRYEKKTQKPDKYRLTGTGLLMEAATVRERLPRQNDEIPRSVKHP
jgi:hypothetical protein